MVTVEKLAQEELDRLIGVLPPRIVASLRQRPDLADLLEVALDLGRVPEARFVSGDFDLKVDEVAREDLDYIVRRIGDFGEDNRAGIERTLHRISAIRNRRGQVVGITCRVGRAVFGAIRVIEDLAFSGKNILLLGRPGVGKTTMLREMARVLADTAHKRVIIVDTSNEVAGDGDVPHSAIGRARRMQVVSPAMQHAVMIEAVENHMPQVIIIDEMSTVQEAAAARTIAERGVQLIATAHGNTLDNLILNPTLSDLVGGVQTVTLGDLEARQRGTQKTVLERKSPPTFDAVVEIQAWNQVAVHDGVAQIVDQWLRGHPIAPEIRALGDDGQLHKSRGAARRSEATPGPWAMSADGGPRPGYRSSRRPQFEPPSEWLEEAEVVEAPAPASANGAARHLEEEDAEAVAPIKVFLFGIGRDKLEAAQAETGVPAQVSTELRRSDVALTTKSHYRRGSNLMRAAEASSIPIYVLRKNTMPQVEEFLQTVARERGLKVRRQLSAPAPVQAEDAGEGVSQAMQEAEEAAQRVQGGEFSVQLTPQRAYVRRQQHLLAERYKLASTSRGREPNRCVLIYRP